MQLHSQMFGSLTRWVLRVRVPGDIALTLELSFEGYLQVVMTMLHHASQVRFPETQDGVHFTFLPGNFVRLADHPHPYRFR